MHVVVVGAGVFGTWTAHHLLAAGARVTLIDAYGPGNLRSSSGDETRILRCGYGPDRIYSELALRSLQQWRELDERLHAPSAVQGRLSQAPIWHGCGVLWMALPDDPYFVATVETLQSGPYQTEVLTRAAVAARFPELRPDDEMVALLEADAGLLLARRSVQSLCREIQSRGVRVVRARATVPSSTTGVLQAVDLSDGSAVKADAFVFACGAWLGTVFPDLLAGRIRPTRQSVVYFGTPAGDDRFSAARMPAWITRTGIYGIPDVEGNGIKVGLHEVGPPMNPDTDDRLVDAESVRIARDWLGQYMPRLAGAPVVESRVCQYENTDTGDFLIDRHPGFSNVWIAGGGSGHGFKHGPAVGELASRLVMTGADTDSRFALAARTKDAKRAVY